MIPTPFILFPLKTGEQKPFWKPTNWCIQKLQQAGCRPQLHRLDNECSQILKDFMKEQQEGYQLVPPGSHRRNSAERAIRTYKNHFIAGLSSADPNFPLNLWDRLVEQSYITLNLLRGSRMNPKLSAYSQIEGEFIFTATPLAPPGIRVLVHEKLQKRGTWDCHGEEGYYIGSAMESYRCFKTYIKSTKGERITDTIEWFPHNYTMPGNSDVEMLVSATNDLLKLLKNPSPKSPIPQLEDSELQALQDLSKIFHPKAIQTKDSLNKQVPANATPLRVAEPPAAPLNQWVQPRTTTTQTQTTTAG